MDPITARLYLCTNARKSRGDFADFVTAAYSGGVDIIQLRDKSIDAAEELDYLEILRSVADKQARLWAVNDRADIAVLAGAPVFHVGQTDLPLPAARSLLGDAARIGLSTHTTEQVDAALVADRLDYFCVGPVWATPTKPGRAAVGTGLLRYAAEQSAAAGSVRPWFAIGGIDLHTIDQVVDAGATRVVVVRAITDADDPTDAARRLLASLPPLG
ncbi:thiamine phosphate synthase [Cryobacterium glaciale]|uniref:Thiamine-phosphate synthase n=1 Tax=Cryobacterium glaciale TaxID=1259145 RepID=A0A4R8V652_9MICO|nr:thiamine phosphate synthase [Cryobacterium glaciale]TFB77395.1 thiamine phosphate synthase [Cryobacterium glaciale]